MEEDKGKDETMHYQLSEGKAKIVKIEKNSKSKQTSLSK